MTDQEKIQAGTYLINTKPIPKITSKILLFLIKRMNPGSKNKCWNWLGNTHKKGGYGNLEFEGKVYMAHRMVYTAFVGKIPHGLTINHKCSNRKCVNPNHLEILTNRDNILIGKSLAAKNLRKKFCKRGHPFDKQNTRYGLYDGKKTRQCRKCCCLREMAKNGL